MAGRPVGGLVGGELDEVLAALADDYPRATVEVETPDGDLTAIGSEIGLALDLAATRQEVLDVGREGSVATRFTGWLRSLTGGRSSEVRVVVDRTLLDPVVADRDPTERTAPTEPGIGTKDGKLVVVPGVDGRGLDSEDLAERIVEEGSDGDLPIVVETEAGTVPPRFSEADAKRLVERGQTLTDEPLAVQAGDTGAEIPSETLRTWLEAVPVADGLQLDIDREAISADLEMLLDDVGEPPRDATFRVEGDVVVIVPGATGTRCCAPEAAGRVALAVQARPVGPVVLPLTEAAPRRSVADAEALGIREPIGSFTTNFKAGQTRVKNIHRISDLTRGVVMEPATTFSVNGHVGKRTVEKGFTTGGVIQNGVFEESVGGGISQYATTLFNAAFFGGLDFEAYQSHSIYISRYPYGREATLSFPQPDLVLENNTPYGVLIWATYTESSVTVTLYSTSYAPGEQTGQSKRSAGQCTRVTTERTRTYVDGHTEVDHVYATYRPEEGVDC
ncbi:MAG: VanW family protein [Acidimicrobiales bacterium]